MRTEFGKNYDVLVKKNKFKLDRYADMVQFMRQINELEN